MDEITLKYYEALAKGLTARSWQRPNNHLFEIYLPYEIRQQEREQAAAKRQLARDIYCLQVPKPRQ